MQWEETQDNLKLTLQRNLYGMHAPVRLLMERKIVSSVRICYPARFRRTNLCIAVVTS